jgi:5'-methylthioadenosine nucleosidase
MDATNTKPRKLLLFCALPAEALPIVEALGLGPRMQLEPSPYPAFLWQRQWEGREVTLVQPLPDSRTGKPSIGAEPATAVLAAALLARPADLVVNAGTAGALKSAGWELGTVVVAQSPVSFIDRLATLPGYAELLVGRYPVWQNSGDFLLGTPRGRIGSGNSLHNDATEWERMERDGIQLKEMEAASLARICEAAGVPFVAIKVVSDILDAKETFESQFFASLAKNTRLLAEKTKVFVSEVLS